MRLDFSKSCSGEYTKYIAVLTDVSQEPREMYLEIPSRLEPLVGKRWANALAELTLFECMLVGGAIHTNMPLEKQLVDNLEQFSAVWAMWVPQHYKVVNFEGETYHSEGEVNALPSAERPDIAAYSGGVDSAYVIAHGMTSGLKPEISLGAAILLHGADIPLDQEDVFERVYKQSEQNLQEFNLPLYPVKTNIRVYNPNWEHIFYTVVTAALRLFSGKYGRGVMGTDQTYSLNTLSFPWGETPITDRFFATPEFGNVPLGCTLGRTARCNIVKAYPTLLDKVRVCWQSNADGGNCGVCDKCIRTKLNLMACGVTGDFPFRVPFSVKQVRTLQPADKFHIAYYRDILEYDAAHDNVLSAEIREAVQNHIQRSTSYCIHAECVSAARELPFIERMLVLFTRKSLTLVAKLRKLFHVR